MLAAGQLDVEDEQRHRHGEDAVGQRLDAVGAEAAAGGARRSPSPVVTGALRRAAPAPGRSAPPAPRRSIAAPSISSASTCSVPPPPQCASRRPSRASSVGVSVGGVAASTTRVRSTRAATPPTRRERARVGRRDGADQVVDRSRRRGSSRWSRPRACGRRSSWPRAEVLRHARRGAGDERGQHAVERDLGGDGHLVEHLARRVVGQDRHGGLRDDVAVVGLLGHVVQRGAGLALAVEHRPVDRRAAAVLRQQRSVHVERAAPRRREQRRLQHLPVVEREQEIRRERGDAARRGPACSDRRARPSGCRIRRRSPPPSRTRSSRRGCRRA